MHLPGAFYREGPLALELIYWRGIAFFSFFFFSTPVRLGMIDSTLLDSDSGLHEWNCHCKLHRLDIAM
jgi:hypothetical protein